MLTAGLPEHGVIILHIIEVQQLIDLWCSPFMVWGQVGCDVALRQCARAPQLDAVYQCCTPPGDATSAASPFIASCVRKTA